MCAVVEAARAAARTCINDANVVRSPPARATAHPVAYVGDGAGAAEARYQTVQVESHHAATRNAHGVQFEVGDEVRKGLHTG
jgi:hypothetical protein